MKNRYIMAIGALAVNFIFALASIGLIAKIYRPFDSLELSSEIKLETAEKLIRLVANQILPAHIAVMTMSAFIFWRLRK